MIRIIACMTAALALAACGSTDYRAQYAKACSDRWNGSGYRTRLIVTEVGHTMTFDCQLLVKGRWIPSENLRVDR